MPDIDPAALSRPSVTLSTPVISTKALSINATGAAKGTKSSQIIPTRIDLEPLYGSLKSVVSSEQWLIYKDSTAEFLTGRLSEKEYMGRIDPILADDTGEKDHLHNQLIAAILGNVTREMPDQGVAPWVSANDKPVTTAGSKPVSGDAAERRLKAHVMQLPARDRRRIKDLVHNDYDYHEHLSYAFSDTYRRPYAISDTTSSAAGGISKMNFDLEIRKRYAQPLAVESGEFPDISLISSRMLPSCYEAGLVQGHAAEAPQLVTLATECFIKEILTQVFSRTRSNGPGDSGSTGFGVSTSWMQTSRYRKQLSREEETAQRGEVTRDKSGLLPVEARAAIERGPLGMADLRLSLEIAETGMAQFPVLMTQLLWGYRDGELENWKEYSCINAEAPGVEETEKAAHGQLLLNGHPDAMDVDDETACDGWNSWQDPDTNLLDGMLDSCLTVRS